MSDSFASAIKIAAQEAAYAAVKGSAFKPTAVIEYQSRGPMLVIGKADSVSLLGDIPGSLTSETLLLDGLDLETVVSISGALGQFEIEAVDDLHARAL